MKKIIVSILLYACLLSLLSGCSSKNICDEIPAEMPSDFDISFCFWINEQWKNVYDTYNNTIQKDLIAKGVASSELIVPSEILEEIYQEIVEKDIIFIKEVMTSEKLTKTNSIINIEPLAVYEITITIDGKTYIIKGDSTAYNYVDNNNKAKQFCSFVNYMREIYYSAEEYKAFPEAVGGYD